MSARVPNAHRHRACLKVTLASTAPKTPDPSISVINPFLPLLLLLPSVCPCPQRRHPLLPPPCSLLCLPLPAGEGTTTTTTTIIILLQDRLRPSLPPLPRDYPNSISQASLRHSQTHTSHPPSTRLSPSRSIPTGMRVGARVVVVVVVRRPI